MKRSAISHAIEVLADQTRGCTVIVVPGVDVQADRLELGDLEQHGPAYPL